MHHRLPDSESFNQESRRRRSSQLMSTFGASNELFVSYGPVQNSNHEAEYAFPNLASLTLLLLALELNLERLRVSVSQIVSTTHLPNSALWYIQSSLHLKYPLTFTPRLNLHSISQLAVIHSHNGFLNSSRGDRPRLLLERIRRNSLLPLPVVPRTFHCSLCNPRRC